MKSKKKNKDNLSEERYPINRIFTVEKKDMKKFDCLVRKNLRRQKNEIKYDFSGMKQVGKDNQINETQRR